MSVRYDVAGKVPRRSSISAYMVTVRHRFRPTDDRVRAWDHRGRERAHAPRLRSTDEQGDLARPAAVRRASFVDTTLSAPR